MWKHIIKKGFIKQKYLSQFCIITFLFRSRAEIMELIYGVVSLVKDIKTADRQFRNLNFQLKYTLQKAQLLLNKQSLDDPNNSFFIQHLYHRVRQAEGISQKLDQLLNAESIAIQDKIRLSMPFNQTKNQAVNAIQGLEKAITDMKEEMDCEKQDKQNGPVKRKISNIAVDKESKNQTDPHVDNVEEEHLEMGPTINDDSINICQERAKPNSVEVNIEVKGEEKILKILEDQFPHILKTTKKMELDLEGEETTLYSVARINFQKCYAKIKNITKDIDRISTKGHFHILLKKSQKRTSEQLQVPQCLPKRSSSSLKKKQNFGHQNENQKQEEQIFFSFPQDDKSEIFQNMTIIMRKEDKSKSVYRFDMGEWRKIQEEELQIGNGEKLAAFVNPATKEPSFFFQVNYQIGCTGTK